MDLVTRDDLRALISYSDGPCVSLYLPGYHSESPRLQDPILLENLLNNASHGLQVTGQSANDIDVLLRPVRQLLENGDFWQHRNDGLAVFVAANLCRTFRVQQKLPELTVVGERFHVKPLLAAFTGNSHFYMLALSLSCPRLFRGSEESLIELEATGMPAGMFQPPGKRPLQGAAAGDHKQALMDYFRRIDEALHTRFLNDPAPVILLCLDAHYPLYCKANSNPALLPAWISGNPDSMTVPDLHKQALAIAVAHFSDAQKAACDQYLALWHTQRASNELSEVLPAALHGRIASLLVAVGVQAWGHLDATTNQAVVSETRKDGDEDLLNLAAIHTYLTGGTVHVVMPGEVPGGGAAAAVFRY